jgi:TonB family protein
MQNCDTTRCHLRVGRAVLLILSTLAICLLAGTKPVSSQTAEGDAATRKVVSRVAPEYPATLKRLYIGGVVRVEVVVAPNGTVESAQVLGGNPILGQSALKAVKRWKYVPASTKEKFVVKFDFDPHAD